MRCGEREELGRWKGKGEKERERDRDGKGGRRVGRRKQMNG